MYSYHTESLVYAGGHKAQELYPILVVYSGDFELEFLKLGRASMGACGFVAVLCHV